MKIITKLWLLIGILIALAPVGIILPRYLKAGAAWGEWGVEEIAALAGYVPGGMQRFSSLWNAPMPGYADNGPGYIASAAAGIAVVAGAVFLIGKLLGRKS